MRSGKYLGHMLKCTPTMTDERCVAPDGQQSGVHAEPQSCQQGNIKITHNEIYSVFDKVGGYFFQIRQWR